MNLSPGILTLAQFAGAGFGAAAVVGGAVLGASVLAVFAAFASGATPFWFGDDAGWFVRALMEQPANTQAARAIRTEASIFLGLIYVN